LKPKALPTIEIDIKHKADPAQLLFRMAEKVPPKKLFCQMAVSYSPLNAMYCDNTGTKEHLDAYKILLYVGGNWDSVLKEAEKYYEKISDKAYYAKTRNRS